jgi:hypothetical protein
VIDIGNGKVRATQELTGRTDDEQLGRRREMLNDRVY